MLKYVEKKKQRHHAAEPRGLEKILLLGRFHMPHQPRIIDALYRPKLHHRCCFFLAHNVRPFPRTAVSRFATAGSPALHPGWASLRASSELSACLAAPLPGTLLS